MHKAVFIDKDGTLIPDIPYNIDPSRISLNAGAAQAVKRLRDEGYLAIVISNQSGLALGYFDETALERVRQKIGQLLAVEGAKLDDFLFCPHHPEGIVNEYALECDCRKPQAGLLFRAAAKYDIDLAKSWMIGDILNDVEAGKRAGCKTILLDNGGETEWEVNEMRTADFVVSDFEEALACILNIHGDER